MNQEWKPDTPEVHAWVEEACDKTVVLKLGVTEIHEL